MPPGGLRHKLAQLEIEAEIIELGRLGALIPELNSPCSTSSASESATAAIETVITTQTGIAFNEKDHEAIAVIAAAAHLLDADR